MNAETGQTLTKEKEKDEENEDTRRGSESPPYAKPAGFAFRRNALGAVPW